MKEGAAAFIHNCAALTYCDSEGSSTDTITMKTAAYRDFLFLQPRVKNLVAIVVINGPLSY